MAILVIILKIVKLKIYLQLIQDENNQIFHAGTYEKNKKYFQMVGEF